MCVCVQATEKDDVLATDSAMIKNNVVSAIHLIKAAAELATNELSFDLTNLVGHMQKVIDNI